MFEEIKSLVRPFISISFVIATIILALTGKLDAENILQLTGIIVAFHFGERAAKVKGE